MHVLLHQCAVPENVHIPLSQKGLEFPGGLEGGVCKSKTFKEMCKMYRSLIGISRGVGGS